MRTFTIGQLIRSSDMTYEQQVEIFGEPIAKLLADSKKTESGKTIRVVAVDRFAGTVTFGELGNESGRRRLRTR